MNRANEGKANNGEPKKSELLPTGDEAKEIVEVLVAMYRSVHKPEAAANDDRSENTVEDTFEEVHNADN
ncbi:MAG TPA: hypothetical protein EYP19_13830 [Desulfobacterales bacterium]|nr:hypothetical protein [Desulfobacterales bacterium]